MFKFKKKKAKRKKETLNSIWHNAQAWQLVNILFQEFLLCFSPCKYSFTFKSLIELINNKSLYTYNKSYKTLSHLIFFLKKKLQKNENNYIKITSNNSIDLYNSKFKGPYFNMLVLSLLYLFVSSINNDNLPKPYIFV